MYLSVSKYFVEVDNLKDHVTCLIQEREFQELNMQYQSLQQKLRKMELTQHQKVQIKQENLLKSPTKASPRKVSWVWSLP